MDHKPCTFAKRPLFRYGEVRNGKDLPGQEEAKAGVLEIFPPEYLLLCVIRNPGPVVFDDQIRAIPVILHPDQHLRNMFAVPQGIFYQVVEDFLEEGVCINLIRFEIDGYPDLGGMHPDILVIAGEDDLVPDRISCLLLLCYEGEEPGIGKILAGDLEVPDERRQLVEDIVPGDIIEQVKFLVRPGQRFLCELVLGDINNRAYDGVLVAVSRGDQDPPEIPVSPQQPDLDIPDTTLVADLGVEEGLDERRVLDHVHQQHLRVANLGQEGFPFPGIRQVMLQGFFH